LLDAGGFGDAAIEDELHLLGPAQIEVLANHYSKKTLPLTGRSSTWVSDISICQRES
jgi:hypothetical protein